MKESVYELIKHCLKQKQHERMNIISIISKLEKYTLIINLIFF